VLGLLGYIHPGPPSVACGLRSETTVGRSMSTVTLPPGQL
jgi:hypothetical protein